MISISDSACDYENQRFLQLQPLDQKPMVPQFTSTDFYHHYVSPSTASSSTPPTTAATSYIVSGTGLTSTRPRIKVACVHCKEKHLACSGERPCGSCKRKGLTDCVDAPRRRPPRGSLDRSQAKHVKIPPVALPVQTTTTTFGSPEMFRPSIPSVDQLMNLTQLACVAAGGESMVQKFLRFPELVNHVVAEQYRANSMAAAADIVYVMSSAASHSAIAADVKERDWRAARCSSNSDVSSSSTDNYEFNHDSLSDTQCCDLTFSSTSSILSAAIKEQSADSSHERQRSNSIAMLLN